MLFLAPVNEYWAKRGARGVSTGADNSSVEVAVHAACAAIGLTIAAAVSLLHAATGALGGMRLDLVSHMRSTSGVWASWLTLVAFSWFFGLLAYLCVLAVPHSRGSGLPQLIAYLNGVKIHGFTSLRVLVAKLMGTCFALGGGFYIGPEGPIIHSGACVGKLLLRSLCRLSRVPGLPATWAHFRNDLDERDFVAIGAGAGVAAAFMAPVSGIIFVVEEASTHFSLALLWRAFFAAITAIWAAHWIDLTEVPP